MRETTHHHTAAISEYRTEMANNWKWTSVAFDEFNHINFTYPEGVEIASVVERLGRDYPAACWRWRVWGATRLVSVWKTAVEEEGEDDDEEEDEEDEEEDDDEEDDPLLRALALAENGEDEEDESAGECVLCGGVLGRYGNNPDPVAHEGQCCDACDVAVVIPARMRLMVRV